MILRRELVLGLVTALTSTVILGGSLVLAVAEDQTLIAQIPADTNTATVTPSPTLSPTPLPTQKPGEPTYTASPTSSPTEPPTSTPETPPPTSCPPPSGWEQITVNQGDTLDSLAAKHNTTAEELSEANCLLVSNLPPGSKIYAPKLPPTPTYVTCGPPPGWVYYTVKSGDNLYRIGLAYGVSVYQLQQANCLGSSTYIRTGQQIFVPNVPTVAVSATPTSTASATATATTAPATATATATATAGGAPTASATPTASPTNTTVPTATATATTVPTETATLLPTATDTPVPTETATPVPSATATETP
ncbi:MAG: LysM peptidoglycan-binding domain-containing protein [Anaerolineales bacterium]|nr:LysM peptidoglycan-binding domain-containing protein [Anaerolineales bacterium]